MWFTNGVRNLPTSVEVLEEDSNLKIFPVPTQDILFVKMDSATGENYQLEIQDVNGNVIHNEALGFHDLSGHSIDVSGLTPGMYLLSIVSETSQVSKKFVKE